MRSLSSSPHDTRIRRLLLLLLLFHVCGMPTWYIAASPDDAVAEDPGARSAASLSDVTQMIIDQVALQLGDLQAKYQDLRTDFDTYKEQHRGDLETLERRLRDDYAQDMGGMELWMRQEHGRAIQELKQQHHTALLAQEARMRQEHDAGIRLLRTELLEQVNQHAQVVEDLSGKVQESMTSWTSVVDAAIQASHRSGSGSGRDGGIASADSAVRAMRGLRPGSTS